MAETDLVDGKVVRRVHVTLDATTVTETLLTRDETVDVAQAILEDAVPTCPPPEGIKVVRILCCGGSARGTT